jgi:WD40 repeat protein
MGALVEPLAAEDPRAVGVYRIEALLGQGGMGRVYLGTSPAGRPVAVKVVHPDLARDAGFMGRFRQEVAAARSVSGAYTAPVVGAGVDDDPPWLATLFVPGPSLSGAVSAAGPWPEAALWKLGAGLAEALVAVHACGVVHRDLKPANILLAPDGPRVIDFGIARALDGTRLTTKGMVIGTPSFMSPEQAEGRPAGPASDVFSLGSVLYFAATANPPFGDGNAPAVLYRIVHTEPALDQVPGRLAGLIAACLRKAPQARPTLAELTQTIGAELPTPSGPLTSYWPEGIAGLIGAGQPDAIGKTRVDPPAGHDRGRPGASAAHTVTRGRPPAPAAPAPGKPRGRRGPAVITGAVLAGAAIVAAAVALALTIIPGHATAPADTLRLLSAKVTLGTEGINSVAFSPGRRIMATGYADGDIPLWNVADPARPGIVAILRSTAAAAGRPLATVTSVAFSPVGDILADTDENGDVQLWDVADPAHATQFGRALKELPADYLAFSPDGQMLAIAEDSGAVKLWNVSDPAIPVPVGGTPAPSVTATSSEVAFSPDGQVLVTVHNGADYGRVTLWTITDPAHPVALSSRPSANPKAGANAIGSVAFTPSGHLLAVSYDNGTIVLWNVTDPDGPVAFGKPLYPPQAVIPEIAISPDGDLLVSVAITNLYSTVSLWNIADPARPVLVKHVVANDLIGNCVAFAPGTSYFAAGGVGGRVVGTDDSSMLQIWDTRTR